VDDFECAVVVLRGWLEEALEQADQGQRAVDHPADVDTARCALAACQDRFHRIDQVFRANFLSYDRINELTKFGGERGGEWPSWVTTVKQGIEHCKTPLDRAGAALAECWEEIAGRAGMTTISVCTTNIAQKNGRDVRNEVETT
jgi:hypothetical protein